MENSKMPNQEEAILHIITMISEVLLTWVISITNFDDMALRDVKTMINEKTQGVLDNLEHRGHMRDAFIPVIGEEAAWKFFPPEGSPE